MSVKILDCYVQGQGNGSGSKFQLMFVWISSEGQNCL